MKHFTRKFAYEMSVLFLIAAISAVHYYNNSLDTPLPGFYRLLYIFPILLAAFRYGYKGSILTAIIISMIYSPHILLSLRVGEQAVGELFDIALFFSVSLLAGILTEKKNLKITVLEKELGRYMIMENYSNSIIESIKSGVVVINKDMLITIINQGAKEILNVEGDCIGQSFYEIFACCENMKDKIIKSACENKPEKTQVDISRELGEMNLDISLFPLYYNNTNKGLVIIIEDITELKRLQQHIQRNDKLAALGELSSGIAHEIRNPLAIIKAIEQTMRNELKNNPEAQTELEIIDEEIERANRIVKLLMDFAKPGKSKTGRYSINYILDDVLIIVKKYVEQHQVEMVFEKNQVPDIEGDMDLLKQAFINIIFNAVEAMPHGGTLTLSTCYVEDNHIRIIIQDSGMGISSENLEKIFNPFFTTKEEGTGLGLSIVHRIVDEHCGIINVASKVGQGTTFVVLLPAKKEADASV